MVTTRVTDASAAPHLDAAFQYITVDAIRLRCLDEGGGTPVVLLHGNGSMIEDFLSSGIIEGGAGSHRFIAFDRPGFGYSERPAGRTWGPSEQAALLLRALEQMHCDRPIIVGHSWGALVALAMALRNPERVAGLVLMAGYYYPMPRARPMPFPFATDIFRHAVEPYMRRLMAPDTMRRVFAPCRMPERFRRSYSMSLALRTSQMQAVDDEAGMLIEATGALSRHYGSLAVPSCLIAGTDDRIVDTDLHSTRLHLDLSGSSFRRVPGSGHMVHHAAPDEVLAAIAEIERQRPRERRSPGRQWLHIGGDHVAA